MHSINVVLFPPKLKSELVEQIPSCPTVDLPYGWKMGLVKPKDQRNAIIISTDYFGGPGEQTARVIKNGLTIAEAVWCTDEDHPINDALRFFGLVKDEGVDEFDTISLGSFRSNEEVEAALSYKTIVSEETSSKEETYQATVFQMLHDLVIAKYSDKVVYFYSPEASYFDDESEISLSNVKLRIFNSIEDFTNREKSYDNLVDHFARIWINGELDNKIIKELRG